MISGQCHVISGRGHSLAVVRGGLRARERKVATFCQGLSSWEVAGEKREKRGGGGGEGGEKNDHLLRWPCLLTLACSTRSSSGVRCISGTWYSSEQDRQTDRRTDRQTDTQTENNNKQTNT